jgi:hypothetical protein
MIKYDESKKLWLLYSNDGKRLLRSSISREEILEAEKQIRRIIASSASPAKSINRRRKKNV